MSITILIEIIEALAAGEELFALEQRSRAVDAELADLMVVHRGAIRRDGARALLQRLGRSPGGVWLEPLLPTPIMAKPIWGHDGAVAWMRLDGDELITRGVARLRRWTAAGRCTLDRPAVEQDDGRLLDGELVFLDRDIVRLCDPDSGQELKRHKLPAELDEYTWRSQARLLDDGHVALRFAEDEPGSLYGPEYFWQRLDPRDGSREPMDPPPVGPVFAGLTALALEDGSLRLVRDPGDMKPPPHHRNGVSAVKLTPDLLLSGADDGVRIHDRDGELRIRSKKRHRCLDTIAAGKHLVTTSRYLHQESVTPSACLWDPDTGERLAEIEAGQRYQDFVSCDPTASRLAFSLDGVLHLQELDGEAAPRPLPLTWHWHRRLAWSEDGARLAVQHVATALCLWDLKTGERERILTTDILDSASFSIAEDGQTALVDHSFYSLRAFSIPDGEALRVMKPGFNLGCSASRGEVGLVGGVLGGYWFNRRTNKRVHFMEGQWVHACHLAGDIAALASDRGVGAVDLGRGELLWRWQQNEQDQAGVAVAGGRVLALDRGGVLRSLQEGKVAAEVEAHRGEGTSLCALADGSVLSGGSDGLLRCWDPVTLEQRWQRRAGKGAVLHISAGGGKLLFDLAGEDAEPSGWHLTSLETGEALPLPGGVGPCKLTPDGERLVSLDRLARLDIIDTRAAEVLETRPFGQWAPAAHLAWQGEAVVPRQAAPPPGDGERTVEVSMDGRLAVLRGGEEEAVWVSDRRWTCADIQGDRLAAGDDQGRLALWRIRDSS